MKSALNILMFKDKAYDCNNTAKDILKRTEMLKDETFIKDKEFIINETLKDIEKLTKMLNNLKKEEV